MKRAFLCALVLGLSVFACRAQEAGGGDAGRLVVATKVAEPFVIAGEGGELSGISVELWRGLAERLELEFEFRVVELDPLLDGVASGAFDAGVGAISVTPERERALDMTHGFFMDGLGIAVPIGGGGGTLRRALSNLFSPAFAAAVGALVLVLLLVGVLVWAAERPRNAEQFPKGPVKGIGSGFWFAAVTMTTVGYGDKAPVTPAGRVLSLVWMFGSIIVISAFTGAIASSLTAAQITGAVRGPEDLRSARVGALRDSATVASLRDRGARPRLFESVDDGLGAVASGELDAFVHDRSILQYRVGETRSGELQLLEGQFEAGTYGIALPPGSALREPMNRALLELTGEPAWEATLNRYLGG